MKKTSKKVISHGKIAATCLVIIIFSIASTISVANSESDAYFKSSSKLGPWIQNYYKNPEPQHIPEAIMIFLRNKHAMSQVQRLDSQIEFFGTALKTTSHNLDRMVDSIDKSPYQQDFLKKIKVVRGSENEIIPLDPNDIDRLWGRFYATGDNAYLNSILKILDYSQKDINPDSKLWRIKNIKDKATMLEMMHKSAIWSLSANSKKHQIVQDFLQNYLSTAKMSNNTKEIIQLILENSKSDS